MSIRYFFLFVLIGLPSAAVLSQSAIGLDNQIDLKHIGKRTYYLEDPSRLLRIDDVLTDKFQSQFVPCQRDVPNFSATASAYWLKFEIQKNVPGNFYLEVGSPFIDSISVFEFDEEGQMISARYSGDDFPYEYREIKISNYLFGLDMPVNAKHTFYLRIKSVQPLFFPLRVGALISFMEFAHIQDYIQGVYFGFMMLIFLYNLFLFFTIREKIYLYYITYILSITLFMASVFGYLFEFLWPNIPAINQFAVVFPGLTMITATLFTQKILDTRKASKKLHQVSHVFTIIGAMICLLVFFNFKIAGLQLAQGGLLLMAIYFLFLGLRFRMKGFLVATYYLVAWGALIAGIIVALMGSLNVIPVMPYVNAMQIGSAFEVLLLSFALGERINTYKKQKEHAQVLALLSAQENELLIREQNSLLEQEVTKRTEKIAIQNEELVTLNEEKDALMGVVAHDIRSPLNQIKGFIQLIKLSASNLSKDHNEYLEEMHRSADRLTQMTSQILDINAINSKGIKLKMKITNLAEIVKEVLKYFQIEAKKKTIRIEFDKGDGSNFANVDRNYLIQILENLISNAIKFSNPKSTIFLRVFGEKKLTKIEIEDNGPGISEEDQKNLFKQFHLLTAKPTAGESSTGLGLSIVKRYIEAMNGEIHCKSVVGEGTKFVVSFKKQSR
jgi:signal transduction histidine kinase